jgi:uncharacterized protein (TIGR00297 family)
MTLPAIFEMPNLRSLGMAAAVSVTFAILARWLRGVTTSGAIAGALVCFIFYAGLGSGGFAVLAALFFLTWAATRTGYRRKQKLGTAESREGRRATQIIANLGAGAFCVIAYRASGNPVWVLTFVAALAEAAADTISSEIGQSHAATARLITTMQEVPVGTDGGISLWGTLAGTLAAVLIAAVASTVRLLPVPRIGIPITAAVLGMFADSFLGAGLERRGILNNDAVNFLSTCIAIALAYLLA